MRIHILINSLLRRGGIQRISKTGFGVLDYLLQVTPLDDLRRLYGIKIFGVEVCVRVKFLVNYRG
ncbi:MAG: hypothetical protein ALECFALPRED_001905 [Alectoria fallacina]|uniref:Uncharacterized protein n=1 Tax=Alectoria fallacina TaxID=1903189 RepID=A0A8H3EFR1_9LECA|nr:MAG: hypothetical protein ALECFALPRED_001905 [Alectoria fallacina]